MGNLSKYRCCEKVIPGWRRDTGDMEPASAVYEAELVERPRRGKTGHHLAVPMELVVRRREDGAEIVRTPAEQAAPEALLATAQDDLLHMSAEQFLAEWKMPDTV